MKNLGRVITAMGLVAGASTLASMLVVGCGPDNTTDGGPDGMADTTLDSPPDVVVVDASDAGKDSGPDANPIAAFIAQEGQALCKRFQTCCGKLDAGAFDLNKCVALSGSGFEGSNSGINAEVMQRGNATLNSTEATSCLAGLATLSCLTVGSTENVTVIGNCYGAVTGTLTAGAGCIESVECAPGNYCKFAGVDAGKSDAGTTLGQCASLIGQGQPCGFVPYGDPNFLSTECEYKGWQPGTKFCDYDSYPDASGYSCQAQRGNGIQCYFDEECTSGICGVVNQDCLNTTCTCLTSRDFSPVCTAFAIQDAGPG